MDIRNKKILITGGPMFLGTEDGLSYDLALLIKGGVIERIDRKDRIGEETIDVQNIDVGGRTILPGFTDAHRHLISESGVDIDNALITSGAITGVQVAKETLFEGITSVRDPGCRHYGIFYLRNKINEGKVLGPTVYAAGPNPTGDAAPQDYRNLYVNSPSEMRRAVRQLKRDGADWIKLFVSDTHPTTDWRIWYQYLTEEEIFAATDEAHALGLRISGHVEGLEAARIVVNAGFDAIEHGTILDEELVDTMAKRGIYYVPTLWLVQQNSMWGLIQQEKAEALSVYRNEHIKSFQLAQEAGVKIAVGTDPLDPIPSANCFVEEMELMIKHGLSSAAVLRAATIVGAEIVGKEDVFGKLAPGFKADIIVVDGNPLINIQAIKKVDLVIKEGTIVKSNINITQGE